MGGARARARDARIMIAIAQMRTQAVIWESPRGTFVGLTCAIPTEMVGLCADITANGGSTVIRTTTTEYCAFSALNAAGGWWFCTDETRATETQTNPATAACAGALFNCP